MLNNRQKNNSRNWHNSTTRTTTTTTTTKWATKERNFRDWKKTWKLWKKSCSSFWANTRKEQWNATTSCCYNYCSSKPKSFMPTAKSVMDARVAKKKSWKKAKLQKQLSKNTEKMNVIKKQKLSYNKYILLLFVKNYLRGKKAFFVSIILLYLFVWLEKIRKSNFICQKTTEQVSTLGDYLILEMRIQILKNQLLIL